MLLSIKQRMGCLGNSAFFKAIDLRSWQPVSVYAPFGKLKTVSLDPVMLPQPLPELIEIEDESGGQICRWSLEDERQELRRKSWPRGLAWQTPLKAIPMSHRAIEAVTISTQPLLRVGQIQE